jgi:2,5-diamino-6-(ribosylamino)-4(3H)-pyrimidinone 5'-phosphate reductase
MTYNEVSIDGRLGGFSGDPADFYRRALRWEVDAILMGSVTALNFGPQETADEQATRREPLAPVEPPAEFAPLLTGTRPLLVVPDSRGRVRNWRHATAQPWYRGVLVLVSASTPDEYLDYLDRRGIEHRRVGERQVDLRRAMALLAGEHGVGRVRTDAGATLNRALLTAGLVDELALLVRPVISHAPDTQTLLPPDGTLPERYRSLQLVETEVSGDGSVLVRYGARRPAADVTGLRGSHPPGGAPTETG